MASHPRAQGMVWWLLVGVDTVIVSVFAVTAATEPYHVLESENIEIHNFQGLLPTAIVVTLRCMVLAAERRLLSVAHGGLVAGARLASLIGFFYLGRWLFTQAHRRWQDAVLGGTLGYALVGIAGIGLAALMHSLLRMRAPGLAGNPTGAGASTNGSTAAIEAPSHHQPPLPMTAGGGPAAPAAARRRLTRETLLGLAGLFQGITGLVLGVTNLTRVAVAVLIGAAVVVAVMFLMRRGPD